MSSNIVQPLGERLFANLERVIIGKRKALELVLIGLLAEGHLLIEDVPGVGKTLLARALSRSLNCSFQRIQFTPDMLPGDVTGTSIYHPGRRTFEFRPGPIFGNIILADEINRATPKTQSALLEAMEERQVTVDGVTHPLPRPFMVLATQNPIEYEGTFPLPEAQLDRFLLRLRLGYPALVDEMRILQSQQHAHPIESLGAVANLDEVQQAIRAVREVYVVESLQRYIVELVTRTRHHPEIALGASPRASLGLFRAAQAWAALQGRSFVLPDDIKALAPAVLAHRLIVQPSARLQELQPERLIQEILLEVPVPGGDFRAEL